MADLKQEIKRRRTFAIISHPDAGKTTLTEKFLLYGGAINQAGAVKGKHNAKHAVSDWMEIEKQRGISVKMCIRDRDYSDTDPFVNEILFCVSEDLEDLNAMGTLEMDGERIILEVKNNKTNEVLWSNTWNGAVRSESFLISLGSLTKDNEYVICLTGTKINYAAAGITFDSNFVQERVKPLR